MSIEFASIYRSAYPSRTEWIGMRACSVPSASFEANQIQHFQQPVPALVWKYVSEQINFFSLLSRLPDYLS